MPFGFSGCSPLVKILVLLRCVSNEILTAQKKISFFISVSSQERQGTMCQTLRTVYACRVMLTNEILGAPAMPPGKFGPALER